MNGKWMYNHELNCEWIGDQFETKEEAVLKGISYYLNDSKYKELYSFFVGQVCTEFALLPNGDDIIKIISDRTMSNSNPYLSEGYLSQVKLEDEEKLTEALKDLIVNWLIESDNNPEWFRISNVQAVKIH